MVAIGLCAYFIYTDKKDPIRLQFTGTPFSLKSIASAQAYFRANDLLGDGKKEYWRLDVAGLCVQKDPKGAMIELIPRAAALADDRAKCDLTGLGKPAPYRGLWYRAILHADEKTPDPKRFAVCAFPGEGKAGKTFIVDEFNTSYWKELGGRCADNFPVDPLKDGWQKVD